MATARSSISQSLSSHKRKSFSDAEVFHPLSARMPSTHDQVAKRFFLSSRRMFPFSVVFCLNATISRTADRRLFLILMLFPSLSLNSECSHLIRTA